MTFPRVCTVQCLRCSRKSRRKWIRIEREPATHTCPACASTQAVVIAQAHVSGDGKRPSEPRREREPPRRHGAPQSKLIPYWITKGA